MRQQIQMVRPRAPKYEFGGWRGDENALLRDACMYPPMHKYEALHRDARDQSRLLDLLGRINYRILKGSSVYIQVGGIVYKTLCGLYWRSVFTGVEHYLLRCQEVSWSTWNEEEASVNFVDLPITSSKAGWTANGQSLMFMLNRE
ncbi:MAG TPA: hypothetical protein VN643_23945 [Pyrinomonadaceae bacterium]|nr:hypothetical protein [Pyrinomonadaceae bacterium]